MSHSNHEPSSVRRLHRWSRSVGGGLVAAAALLGGARQAHAACEMGDVTSCTADDGCPGIKYCEDPYWGACEPIEDCHAPPGYDPNGTFDVLSLDSSHQTVTVYGWALDKDFSQTSIQVRVTVDGYHVGTVLADQYRPDVGAAFPGVGDYHGFLVSFPAEAVGEQRVCVRALNLGSGSHTTIGCKDYTIAARATTTWGQADATRCVADPVQAVSSLATSGTNFGFTTSSGSEGLGYSPGTPHLQGITRIASGQGQYTVVSRSGSWAYYVVHQNGQGWGGGPFLGGVTAADRVVARIDNNVGAGLDHAGGVSSIGTLLAVPNENHVTDDPGLPLDERTHVAFYDLSNPEIPNHLGILGRDVLQSHEAGAAAMARLTNNRLLLAVGRNESDIIDFYASEPGQVSGWIHIDTWQESERQTELPDGDDEFGDYQSLTFVTRCGDGGLFLLGTHRATDWSGADWVDLFRLDIDGTHAMLTKVAKRHVECDGNCNLDASGGGYVTPDGQLRVYATEHAANGPTIGDKRSVRARQF